jgi:hypothetical protein
MRNEQVDAVVRARVEELRRELSGLEAFLRNGTPGRSEGRPTSRSSSLPKPVKGARRKPMTAEERKAVGDRMRKYWAAKRKADKQKHM